MKFDDVKLNMVVKLPTGRYANVWDINPMNYRIKCSDLKWYDHDELSEAPDIPTIYASIGNRVDVSTNPAPYDVIASVFESPAAEEYHANAQTRDRWTTADVYIHGLETALREALTIIRNHKD